jgi:hypothetical protein
MGHRLTSIANYLRRVLIEDIYGRLSKRTSFGKGRSLNIVLFSRYHVPRGRGLVGPRGRVSRSCR